MILDIEEADLSEERYLARNKQVRPNFGDRDPFKSNLSRTRHKTASIRIATQVKAWKAQTFAFRLEYGHCSY